MHPISSTLAVMVERTSAKTRHAQRLRDDPREFERAIYHALTELNCTRPRIVAFAPAKALKRVLALPEVHRHLSGVAG
jgi:hypothetical protein